MELGSKGEGVAYAKKSGVLSLLNRRNSPRAELHGAGWFVYANTLYRLPAHFDETVNWRGVIYGSTPQSAAEFKVVAK